MKKTSISLVILCLIIAVLAGCNLSPSSNKNINIVVSILPQVEFVKSIGKEKVSVVSMVPPGANPHIYEPSPSQMVNLANASMYAKVGSGVEFELSWMDKLVEVNKKMLVVDCSKNLQFIRPVPQNGQHAGAIDPHVWMSPLNAQIMVKNICDGIVAVDPGNSSYYVQNRDYYLQVLTQLDKDIRNNLGVIKNKYFVVYHPALAYFAKEYELNMITIEEEGKEPSMALITRIVEQAKENKIKVVFASPQFNPQSAEIIAHEIGGKVVYVDDLAMNYQENTRLFLNELKKALVAN
jgi:zinc transport system substrate-binding protein